MIPKTNIIKEAAKNGIRLTPLKPGCQTLQRTQGLEKAEQFCQIRTDRLNRDIFELECEMSNPVISAADKEKIREQIDVKLQKIEMEKNYLRQFKIDLFNRQKSEKLK